MSVFHENMLIGASGQVAAGGISRSLRFNSPDSAYLSRTPASAGNRKTWTWAGWVKRSALGSSPTIFNAGGNGFVLRFDSDVLEVYNYSSSAYQLQLRTTQVFRDPSAWAHVVFALDTTQSTPANRAKLYINGVQVSAFSTETYPNQDALLLVNNTNVHVIGNVDGFSLYFNGYLADIHFIDGQALTPSSFTETDATTGQLIPKAFSGSYGSQGWHLEFADNSAATAAALGKDTSGNGLNWTPNNLSVTAGAGNDSLVDVPTNGSQTDTGVGGEVRGNYCTLNPLDSNSSLTLQNGNLYASNGAASHRTSRGTIAITSGKWYWEVTLDSALTGSTALTAGIATSSLSLSSIPGTDANSYGWYNDGGGGSLKYNNNSSANYGSVISNGVVVGVAFDANAGTLTFYRNGSSQGTAYSSIPAGTYFPTVALYNVNATVNFGQRPFAYTAPSGFKALCTANLPAPLVTKPNTVMDVVLYTGTGSSLTLPYASSTPTSIAFTPDLVWIKGRSGATDHALYDAVRDVQKDLASNSTAAETTQSTGLTAFGTNTFTIGSLAKLNTSSATYAAWCWDAGSSTVTNTQGSITSSVRANATAGFSVVTWTGDGGTNKTVGHGLGVAPELIIAKWRGGSSDWEVYSKAAGATKVLQLNATNAASTLGHFGSTNPTSTVFTVNASGTGNEINGNGQSYVAYVFSPVVGYSSFGSYTGNGSSTDGPFVYTGFRPRFLLVKSSSFAEYWEMYDTARDTYNIAKAEIFANTSGAEGTASALDFLSNGFKIKTSGSGFNSSSQTYIWAAWAESPFQYARAR
jgi:hypothetical protein